MNPKAANTAKPAPKPVSQKEKDAAKQCLMLADKFLKESNFAQAREEVAKAQKLDPTNPYAYAFLDRISYFEEQKKKPGVHEKASPHPPAHEEPKPTEPPKQTPPPAMPKLSSPPAPQVKPTAPPPAQKREPPPAPVERKPEPPPPSRVEVPPPPEKKPEPPPPPPKKEPASPPALPEEKKSEPKPAPKADSMIEASKSVIADLMASRTKGSQTSAPGISEVLQQLSQAQHQHSPNTPKGDIDSKLDEMKRQIEMLTSALEQERKVREEMNQQQLKGAIKQFRSALEKAWANGAPKDHDTALLQELATSLGIPEDVAHTVNREVKLDMYSRAVKEVVSKQNLLRNSSRTLEWLRKVYQVSLDEYLEYESKFLMDLVADQYKGTILLVSTDSVVSRDVGLKLKSTGYAVVNATSPENALEKIEKINPHFILCDMEFAQGSLSGIKFLHVLRANSKFNYIPFILMCDPQEVKQFNAGDLRPTEGIIQKPIETEQLNTVMNEKLMAFRQYLSSL